MNKSAVVQSRMNILDLATITRHFKEVRRVPPGSISETISIAMQVLATVLHAKPFTSPTEALEYMHENGYGRTLKTGSKALAKQIAEEETALLKSATPESLEGIEITEQTMQKLNRIREEKGTS